MAKCVSCGKGGFFRQLNAIGLCAECAQEERRRAHTYYEGLCKLYEQLHSPLVVQPTPDSADDYFAEIATREEILQNLLALLPEGEKYYYIDDIVSRHITYASDLDRRIHSGQLMPMKGHIWTNRSPLWPEAAKLFEESKTLRHQWRKREERLRNHMAFTRALANIPIVPISPDLSAEPSIPVEQSKEPTFSSITAKSNYWRLGSFVVIDVETTGLRPRKDRITEVSAVKFVDWEPVAAFTSLINPGCIIPDKICTLTGITNSMVCHAPTFDQIRASLSDFIGKSDLVGHNLPFDLDFIIAHGWDPGKGKRKYYDTLALAKKTLRLPRKIWDRDLQSYEINYNVDYDVEDCKLTTLCDHFAIRDNSSAHRALSDSLATGYLFQRFAEARADKTT